MTDMKSKCSVCERKGSGMHYGAVTCEGCKAFFRRMMDKQLTYACLAGNTCIINRTVNRACCRACRFEKCLKVGMKVYGARLQQAPNKTELKECADSAVQTDDNQWITTELVALESRNVPEPSPCRSVDTVYDDGYLMESPMIMSPMHLYDNALDTNQRRKLMTIESVMKAVGLVFGEQLFQWRSFMEEALLKDQRPQQPQTDLDTMVQAVHWHNRQVGRKAVKFLTMLPGIDELPSVEPRSLVVGWKWLAFWILYQSPFLTSEESFLITDIQGQPYHYCRYWQDQMTDPSLNDLVYRFATGLNGMHLTQLETFLLAAIIMFEPESDQGPADTKSVVALEILHRHYTDVLVDVLKHRCPDQAVLSNVCQELGHFFGDLKRIYQLYTNYMCGPFKALVHRNIPM